MQGILDRPARRLIALNRFGAEVAIAPSSNHESVQNFAKVPSPSCTVTEARNMAETTLSSLEGITKGTNSMPSKARTSHARNHIEF